MVMLCLTSEEDKIYYKISWFNNKFFFIKLLFNFVKFWFVLNYFNVLI